MSRFFRFRPMLALAIVGSLSLIGCDDNYSNLVTYALRTDPLPVGASADFGAERWDPDSPAQLPLFSLKQIQEPSSPYYPKRDSLVPKAFVDPTSVNVKDRAIIKRNLDSWFGTPRNPKAVEAPPSLGLDEETLAEGSKLFRVHCMHCHGVAGDGHGVTAKWVVPHPRDFRQMLFKFQAVDQTGGEDLPPRREDLRRTLLHGVEATAMPAFNLLSSQEIEKLISYVMHLSVRGKVEYDTFRNAFDYADGSKLNLDEGQAPDEYLLDKMTTFRNLAYKSWEKSAKKPIVPKLYPYDDSNVEEIKGSVQRGYEMFMGDPKNPFGKDVNCVACHKNFGREATFRFDSWGTLVRPNNLVDGIYRGGRRTEDLYDRIHSGINGSGMLRFGQLEQKDARVVWDLVNFVRMLPYPAMREKYGIEIK